MASQNPDESEIIEASGESTLKDASKKAQRQVDQLFNVSLAIGVTGESGAGKSTFINAIRGLADDDEGAAETGVTETTTEPTPYEHPTMPNVVFWDLPGVGTPNFPAKTYLKKVKFERYDFFIIISAGRFKENDIRLAKEIRRKKKLFYFIRSKIDNDVREEEHKKSFNREDVLSKIRRDCEENLQEMENPKVFLISSISFSEFDFEDLVSTLMSELPQLKQQALLQSLPVSSLAILEHKVRMFEKAAWAAALLSGGIALAPIPGLAIAGDVAILVAFLSRCYFSFGLDSKSLQKLSERVKKPDLLSLRQPRLVKALQEKSTDTTEKLQELGEHVAGLLGTTIPVAGAVASFVTVLNFLKSGVKELADTAREVLKEAGLE